MLNPWAGLILVVAMLAFVVAWKGTQDNVITALTGRAYGNTTLGGAGGSGTSSSTATTSALTLTSTGPAPLSSLQGIVA